MAFDIYGNPVMPPSVPWSSATGGSNVPNYIQQYINSMRTPKSISLDPETSSSQSRIASGAYNEGNRLGPPFSAGYGAPIQNPGASSAADYFLINGGLKDRATPREMPPINYPGANAQARFLQRTHNPNDTTEEAAIAASAVNPWPNQGNILKGVRSALQGYVPEQPTDYMAEAMKAITGVDYQGMMDRARQSESDASSRVNAMYRALQGERRGAETDYNQYRDTATDNINASADAAAADIAAGYQNSMQTQANELAALGIADALGQSAQGNLAEDAGYNQGLAETIGSNYVGANEANRANDLAYNQDMIGVAGFQNNEVRSDMTSRLLDRLAEYDLAEQQQNMSLPQMQLDYANSLYGWENKGAPSFTDMLAADEFQYQQGQDQQQLIASAWGDAAKAYPGDPAKQKEYVDQVLLYLQSNQ